MFSNKTISSILAGSVLIGTIGYQYIQQKAIKSQENHERSSIRITSSQNAKGYNEERNLYIILCAYINAHSHKRIPSDIINIIYSFYSIKMISNIMSIKENFSFMDLLFNRFKQQSINIKSIHTKLLYRASDHFRWIFNAYDLFDDEAPTITIIYNEHGHIFAGYTSISWNQDKQTFLTKETDPNAFLFIFRPIIKCFEYNGDNKNHQQHQDGINCLIDNYGLTFGTGLDIQIDNDMVMEYGMKGRDNPVSFEFCASEMFGCMNNVHFNVLNFEVFSVVIDD